MTHLPLTPPGIRFRTTDGTYTRRFAFDSSNSDGAWIRSGVSYKVSDILDHSSKFTPHWVNDFGHSLHLYAEAIAEGRTPVNVWLDPDGDGPITFDSLKAYDATQVVVVNFDVDDDTDNSHLDIKTPSEPCTNLTATVNTTYEDP